MNSNVFLRNPKSTLSISTIWQRGDRNYGFRTTETGAFLSDND